MEIGINGKTFQICRIGSRNRNAWARLKGDTIVVSIPSRWPSHEKEKTYSNLLKRAVRSIEKGRWKHGNSTRVGFFHGQRVNALGKEYEIAFLPMGSANFCCKISENRIEVRMPHSDPVMHDKASGLVRRRIIEDAMPGILERVKQINETHFQADIKKVSIRDNTSRWGSCSTNGAISLGFRLLFMPTDILDYVIVHELAHTRYKSHGKRFWGLVEKAIPDHSERKIWLRQNGWSYPKAEKGAGQRTLGDFDALSG